mmetsp:Transcript_9731/g.36194  ORF Transcript_9731/g.36194 Transcript_9731/m.36194 type:complete len:626 (-) Transcript_9731:2578-4455(-)
MSDVTVFTKTGHLFCQSPVHFRPIESVILPSEQKLLTGANDMNQKLRSHPKERLIRKSSYPNDTNTSSFRKTMKKIAQKQQSQNMSELREWKARQMRERRRQMAIEKGEGASSHFELVLEGSKKAQEQNKEKTDAPFSEHENDESSPQDPLEEPTKANQTASPQSTPYSLEKESTKQPQLTYKVSRTENKVVPCILEQNGFSPSHSDATFNVYWCGSHLRAYLFKSLNVFQKVNHFPKSFELTRKSNMYRKYMEMKTQYPHAYDYLPRTWVLPKDYSDLTQILEKRRFNEWFIVKPASSSSGRGISLVNNVTELLEATGGGAARTSSPDEEYVCSDYVANPLLVNGFKFDLRLYVAVTSYNPLRIYLYEDGLVRFSAEKYSLDPLNRSNSFIHLTNYAINMNNDKFVFNTDEAEDGVGNKWSLHALRKYLRHEGIDDVQIFRRIEDVLIKSILTVESDQRSALRTFVPHPHTNCFELFGFDVLIDSDLKPWVMEINLSPSLSVGTPLDKKIKVSMLTDLFNMIDVRRYNPIKYRELRHQKKKITAHHLYQNEKLNENESKLVKGLHGEQRTVLIQTLKEDERKGDFKRIFPSKDSHLYGQLMTSYAGLNAMLYERLYGNSTNNIS